jgi:hypothetical protein
METNTKADELLFCTLPSRDLAERVTAWDVLARRALVGMSRGADSATFRFRQDAAVEEELRRLLDLERDCCSVLGWDLAQADRHLVLTITGSAELATLRDALIARLRLQVE